MSDENFDIAVHVWIPRDRFKTLYQQSVKEKVEVRHLVRELIVEHVPGTPPAARPAPTATNDTDKHIARRNAEGANDLEIAEELGIGRHAVHYRRTQLGLPAAPRRGRPQKRGDS